MAKKKSTTAKSPSAKSPKARVATTTKKAATSRRRKTSALKEAAPFDVGSGPATEPSLDSLTDSVHEEVSEAIADENLTTQADDTVDQATFENEPSAERTAKRPWDREENEYHLQLPFDAEHYPAPERRYRETVVFVPHFGGNKKSLTRHISAVNKMGFDAVVFSLIYNDVKPKDRLPITGDLKFGARHIWAEQIEAVLNAIPGRKVVFSFSMPSASALAAISRRQAKDIAAWVCDGGPFLQLPRCVWNLYKHEYEVKSRLVRGAFTGLSLLLFGLGFEKEVAGLLADLPHGFDVLSIRGWRDALVPPAAIDDVFGKQSHLDLESLSLSDVGHLDGLKRSTEEYTIRVERFLGRACTPL